MLVHHIPDTFGHFTIPNRNKQVAESEQGADLILADDQGQEMLVQLGGIQEVANLEGIVDDHFFRHFKRQVDHALNLARNIDRQALRQSPEIDTIDRAVQAIHDHIRFLLSMVFQQLLFRFRKQMLQMIPIQLVLRILGVRGHNDGYGRKGFRADEGGVQGGVHDQGIIGFDFCDFTLKTTFHREATE